MAVVGQLAIVANEKSWQYGVIVEIFDDRCIVKKQDGFSTNLYTVDKGKEFETKHFTESVNVELLYKNKKPAMCKKTIFGNYKFPKR